jgi:four helix bundle protein
MHPYERFDAWKAAHAFALAAYRQTKTWPDAERYGLVSQVRRAAFSVPANIVEGRARLGRKEFRRFLDIAWGSLSEVGYALHFAHDVGILSTGDYEELERLRSDAAKPLLGLLRSMGV